MLAPVEARIPILHPSPLVSSRFGSKPRRHFGSRMVDLLNSSLPNVELPKSPVAANSSVSPLKSTAVDGSSSQPSDGTNNSTSIKIRTEPFEDHYETEEELGRGKFAVVRRCRRKAGPVGTSGGSQCAAKMLRRRRVGKDCRADIMHEVGVLEAVRGHPRFVQLVEVFESARDIAIVTEYAAGGELFRYIEGEERLGEATVVSMIEQVVEGLAFLHDHNIVHMDVKPQNILLTEAPPSGLVKICDLGLARYVQAGEDVREIMGTPDYVAPEVLQYEPITSAADMWSVGVLAYVLLTGCSPFAGDTKQETFCNIGVARVDFPDDLFSDVSPAAVDFISKLLVRQPGERMTAHQSLAHPWLQAGVAPAAAAVSQAASILSSLSLPQIGSPAGTRRSHNLSSDLSLNGEPLKKSRCDDDNSDEQSTTCEAPGHDTTEVIVTLTMQVQQQEEDERSDKEMTSGITSEMYAAQQSTLVVAV